MKKVRMDKEKDGMPVTALREVRILQASRHKNIVNLLRVVTGRNAAAIFLVFEYCEHDMSKLIESHSFSESEVKCLVLQLLQAVHFLHSKWIFHRDLKLSNLLLNQPRRTEAVRLWAREVLPARERRRVHAEGRDAVVPRPGTSAGDGQVRRRRRQLGRRVRPRGASETRAAVPGESRGGHVGADIQTVRVAERADMAGVERASESADVSPPRTSRTNYLELEFPKIPRSGVDLLNRLLTYDPRKRCTAKDALEHDYFKDQPLPKRLHDMPTFPSAHDANVRGLGRESAASSRVGGRRGGEGGATRPSRQGRGGETAARSIGREVRLRVRRGERRGRGSQTIARTGFKLKSKVGALS